MKQDGGLLAHPEVKYMIDNEPQLKEALARYLFSETGHHTIPFVLPAPVEEMKLHKANPGSYKLMFPQVTLCLARKRNPVNGLVGVEVTCNDADLEVIARTNAETFARKVLSRKQMLI